MGAYGSERGCVRRRRPGRRAGRRRGRGRRGRPWGSTATPARPAPDARSPRSPTAPPPAAAAPWRRLRPMRTVAAAADTASPSLATSRSGWRSGERKVELAATASPRRRQEDPETAFAGQAFPEKERRERRNANGASPRCDGLMGYSGP